MASKQTCREVAAVPPERVPQKLSAFFADMACKVFDEYRDPNSPPDETRVRDELVTPLQWMLCGGDPAVAFCSLEEHQTQSNFCGKVFRGGEPAYFCKDCQTDPTCCFCMECFEHSEHKNHNYRLFASGGGGCCDCGDPEAWTSFVHCDIHKPSEQNELDVDPVEALPSDLVDRARPFFLALLRYCMDMLCWETSRSLPPSLMQSSTARCLDEPTFVTFLYNDEEHSYDEVILTLTNNLKKTHTDAVALATFVDRKGRAVSNVGTEEKCVHSKELINRDLRSGKPLKVMVFHSAVAAHQTCAVLCLSLLKELAEKLEAFRRLISEALVQVSSSGLCVLDQVFLKDNEMWITARLGWHRLVMSSIFMDVKYKPQLAVNLTKNYFELLRNFVADSHNHDVCASNMTVQLFTVPSLSRMLVMSHGLLEKIVSTLTEMVAPCKSPDTGVLKLTSAKYDHSRVSYIMFDLRYVLRNKPESLADMRQPVLVAFTKFLDLLGMVQNADPVKRQRGSHVEREEPWENLFNFLIILQSSIQLFIQWCISDQDILCEAVRLTLKKHKEVAKQEELLYKRHEVSPVLCGGNNKIELYVFDVHKQSISIHQPLARVLAGLLTGADAHSCSLTHLLQISPTNVQTPLFLMEHSMRVLVMAVQVLAGMWKRNGYSLFRQVVTYQYHYPREMMYDKDIVMLQAMAAVLDPSVFLYSIIYKFRLDTWITCPDSDPSEKRGEPSEDALRFFLSEAEEFVFLLITVFCERYVVGVGQGVQESDSLRRELIHKLFITPMTHSQILKEFRMSEKENEIDRLLKHVATLRKGGGMTKAVFILHPECEKEYSPFFYHYNRTDHSMAEEAHRRRIKASGGIVSPESAAPSRLPPFCQPFQNIIRLSTSPVMHRILHCVFKQAADPGSKFWSDRLLHEALYLCAVMMREEDISHPQSLCNAAIGVYGANKFLDSLSSLLTSRRAEEHKPLLTWIIQRLKKHRKECTGESSPPTSLRAQPSTEMESESGSPPGSEDTAAQDKEVTAKKELAKKQRERAMEQMQNMQRRFLEKNKEHMLDLETGGEDEVDTGAVVVAKSPTLRAVGLTVFMDRPSEAMDVTCILCQADSKDSASQEKVFVQAVCVQRSCVLRRGDCTDVKELDTNFDYLSARADHPLGVFTGGCGHHMHAECWRKFVESKQQEHSRRYFFPLPGQSVQWTSGEFLCPLCQCFGNSVAPLLPPVCSSSVPSEQPQVNVGFSEWREIVDLAVDLAESDNVLEVSSTSPTLWDKLTELFSNFKIPSSYMPQGIETERVNVITVFTQCTYRAAFKTVPDEDNERVCVAEWNNCAYTISSLEMNARQHGQSLLSSLSSRQVDFLGSLVKMGYEPKLRPSVKQLGSHVRKLVNFFLLESPPFTENPSITEVDAFSVMVYLHFAVVSLLASLVSPSGRLEDSSILPAIMGLTALQTVRLAAAARLLQFLLTSSPGMETSESSRASSGSAEGEALQKLWVTFRHRASLPCDCPPHPASLLSGAREYLDPFLQCSVLFFQSLTGIHFTQPSDESMVFSEMCKFLNVPHALHTLLDEPETSFVYSIRNLAHSWCDHSQLRQLEGAAPPPILQQQRLLISLPKSYSELVNRASKFQCPNHVIDGDDGQAAMLCLLCGQMLCTNSYCCMHDVEGEETQPGRKPLRIGGFTHHSQTCGDGLGVALWILESYVVLLDATDLHHVKGCTLTPPYLDQYGESDPGLRRGTPLILNEESFQQLQKVWFQHRIPERITQEIESNRNLLRIVWSQM